MKNNEEKKNLFLNICSMVIYLFIFVIMLFLFIDSFFNTSYMFPLFTGLDEITIYYKDNILISILVLISFVLIVYFFKDKFFSKKKNKLIICILFLYLLISFIWVLMANNGVRADDSSVYDAAIQFSNNNYSYLESGNYLFFYPYQLGLVFFEQFLYWFFGNNTLIVFQLLNCISISCAFYYIIKIFDNLFNNKIINLFISILLFSCIMGTFYCSFVYGNVISFSFSVISVYLWILFLKSNFSRKKIFLLIGSIISMSFSYTIKSTSLIVIIALIILSIFYFIDKKDKMCLIYILLIILCFNLPMKLIYKFYENESGIKINSGIPMIGWVSMGLNESVREYGWYNGWTVGTYCEVQYDNDEFQKKAYDEIIDRINYFSNNMNYSYDFFYKKLSSEWNNPTFQSMWVISGDSNNRIVKSLKGGKLNDWFYKYANYYQLIIYFGVLLFLLFNRKVDYLKLSLLLVVIGGFIFYIFWEAKGQYTFQYFVFMIPYAGVGYINLCDFLKKKVKLLR